MWFSKGTQLNLVFTLTKIKRKIIRYIRLILHKVNVDFIKYSELKDLKLENKRISFALNNIKSDEHDRKFLQYLDPRSEQSLQDYLHKSHSSELHQDVFVLSILNFKHGGFFIEFGATNGIDGSNTFLLEKDFGWKGILAEPAKGWHNQLLNNRPLAKIEFSCVWRDSDSLLSFKEIPDAPAFSTVTRFANSDLHSRQRKHGSEYKVKTISLNDLLKKFSAPKIIDYLSIDTEGSEYEILENFDFSKHIINIIHCEHNYNDKREAINSLLESKGFKRVFTDLSLYDDWFVNLSLELE